jgi:hypothetical protein
MPTPTFQPPQGQQSTAQLQDWIIKLIRDLNYLLGNLDTVNINRLDAKVIIAQSITALQIAANTITSNEIAANAITTDELQAGAVTADKITVAQLSAISANLGTITAGIIYGAYIATANGTYPRIEFSSVGNLLGAYLDATHSLIIEPNVGGAPGIGFHDPSGLTGRIYGNSGLGMIALIDNIELTSLSGSIDMNAVSLLFNSIDVMAAINAKVSHGSTGSTSVSDGHNHGFTSSDYIQCYDSAGTPTLKKAWVPYAGSSSHSHTI